MWQESTENYLTHNTVLPTNQGGGGEGGLISLLHDQVTLILGINIMLSWKYIKSEVSRMSNLIQMIE